MGRFEGSNLFLSQSKVGDTGHADISIAPVLLGHPFDDVMDILNSLLVGGSTFPK